MLTIEQAQELDYNQSREELRKLMGRIGLEPIITYIGENVEDGWGHDLWSVALGTFRTEYRTGFGHRIKAKPYTPDSVDVIASLVVDAEALDYSFNEWCDTYGYDNDSIKAYKIYAACCDIGERMRSQIDRDSLELLQTLANQI